MEQTFGGFVRQRRSSMGITLRGLAARLGLSPVYMSNIETDRKPAPTQEYLEKLAQELHLNVDERRYLLDLAAKSKEQCVSADLPEYIMERDIVRAALRTAKEVDATDEEWQAFIDRLTQRDKDQKGGEGWNVPITGIRCWKPSRERCCVPMMLSSFTEIRSLSL